jgi:hypothetical protein
MKKFQFTMLVIAVLSSSIALVSTPAFAQNSGTTGSSNNDSDFSEFLTCMFDGNDNGSVSETEIRSALGSGSTTEEPTESEIRDCFAPIYITGSSADDEDEEEGSGTTGSTANAGQGAGEESGTTGFTGVTPQN